MRCHCLCFAGYAVTVCALTTGGVDSEPVLTTVSEPVLTTVMRPIGAYETRTRT